MGKIRVKRTYSADTSKVSAESLKGSNKKRMYLLMVVALVLFVTALVVGAPSKLVHSFARSSLASFDTGQAELWLQFSQKWLPNSAERELIAARIARRNGDFDLMMGRLETARRLGALTLSLQIEEAMAAAQSGAVDLVEPQLYRWLENGQGEADEISDAYCNGLAANSRFDRMKEVLEAWQKDYPNDPRPDYRRGRMYEFLQQWDEATKFYLLSLAKNQNFFPARYRLGRIYLLEKKLEEAVSQFERCLEMSQPEVAKTSLAICYRGLGQPDQAKGILRDVLGGKLNKIERSYRSVEEQMVYFEAAANLGDLEAEAGNLAEAERWLLQALKYNDRDLQSRYSWALVLRQQGQTEKAESELSRVTASRKALEQVIPLRGRIEQAPNDPELRLQLGELLLEHESPRNGLFWIKSVFAIDPRYRPAHQALAKYYLKEVPNDPTAQELALYHSKMAEVGNE